MNFLSHTIIKKSLAAMLLILMVFIHTEKVIHHHEKNTSESQKEGFSHTSTNFTCSICDYVFAKDGELPATNVVAFTSNSFQEKDLLFLPGVTSLVYLEISDRGPPSC